MSSTLSHLRNATSCVPSTLSRLHKVGVLSAMLPDEGVAHSGACRPHVHARRPGVRHGHGLCGHPAQQTASRGSNGIDRSAGGRCGLLYSVVRDESP